MPASGSLASAGAVGRLGRGDIGNHSRKVVPLPGALSTRMWPPIWLTMPCSDRQPESGALADLLGREEGSKTRLRVAGSMPCPVSRHDERLIGARAGYPHAPRSVSSDVDFQRLDVSSPPPGIASRALSVRFSSTCSSCLGSARTVPPRRPSLTSSV